MSIYGSSSLYGSGGEAAYTTAKAGEVFAIKKGDTAPSITDTIQDSDGNVVDLSLASSVKFLMSTPSGSEKVNAAGSITDAASGDVKYDWTTGDTDTVGRFRAEWQVTWNDGRIQTFPQDSYRTVRVYSDLGD